MISLVVGYKLMKLLTPDIDNGQVLIIGGGIANFTDVAETFKGIVKAIRYTL